MTGDNKQTPTRPRLLDLFCGAGGAAVGYARAGFEVVGIDIEPQPNYPYAFEQADALDVLRDLPRAFHGLAAIHASPPCQAFSTMKVMANAREHADLLTPTRERLVESGLPYVIENVPGAPIDVGPPDLFGDGGGIVLCGSMFGLRTDKYELRRHRWFESNIPLPQPSCAHTDRQVVGIYGDHARIRARVDGHKDRGSDIVGNAAKLAIVSDLMGIDWMKWTEANQAIPPAYTQWIGEQLLATVGAR